MGIANLECVARFHQRFIDGEVSYYDRDILFYVDKDMDKIVVIRIYMPHFKEGKERYFEEWISWYIIEKDELIDCIKDKFQSLVENTEPVADIEYTIWWNTQKLMFPDLI